MDAIDLGPCNNKLLAALPRKDFQLLAPHLSTVCLAQGAVLFEPDQQIDEIFFPHCGMISMVVVMRDGNTIETATIGREGIVGAMSGFGSRISGTRVIAHLPTFASRISVFKLRNAVGASTVIAELCMRFSEVLLAQAQITAACNALHQIDARLCRWLLQTRDRAESDTIPLTQEFLAEMLGVHRTTVTEAASKLQIDKVIRYQRGVITILDLEKLKATSCECYETLREHASQILPYERSPAPPAKKWHVCTYAGDVYIVIATKDGETDYWVAATPREEALDAVRDQLALGWTLHLTDQLLPSEMVAQLDMRGDSVLRLKVS